MRLGHRCLTLVICGVLPSAALAGLPSSRFTLGKAVPDDCWMYMHGVRNPERVWLEEAWSEVLDALMETGIDQDVMALISSLIPEKDRPAMDAVIERGSDLLRGVAWGDLLGEEVVFAERFGEMPPGVDYFLLTRGKAGSAEANITGIVAILHELASLSDKVSVVSEKLHGVDIWRVDLGTDGHGKTIFSVALLRRGDVIGFVSGAKTIEQVSAMLAGKSKTRAIVDTPRFTEAIKLVPTPENGVMFFDYKMMVSGIESIFDKALAGKKGKDEETARTIMRTVLDLADFMDFGVASMETEGRRELVHAVNQLQPGSATKPLAKVLLDRKPFERFDKFIPVDAKSFSLSGTIDFAAAYDLAIDFIQTNVPNGAHMITQWKTQLDMLGFDPHRDLFSWLSGEMISVTLPPAAVTPMGGSADNVIFIRVTDEELASSKVNAGINQLNAILQSIMEQTLIITPAPMKTATGFQQVTHPMLAMMYRPVVGVIDGWLVFATSPQAVDKCLDVAAGKAPSIRENDRFKEEGLIPTGAVASLSFTDLSNLGQEMAGATAMIGMFGGMAMASIPPNDPGAEQFKEVAQSVLAMLMKLSPVLQKVDFFSSNSSMCWANGDTHYSESVVAYKLDALKKNRGSTAQAAVPMP